MTIFLLSPEKMKKICTSSGIIAILMFSSVSVSGQVSVKNSSFKGRESVTLENNLMRITMLTGGGYIGEIRLKSSDKTKSVNPMRVPHYKTIDPQDYIPAQHDLLYGAGSDQKVMAGYMGHFLCFPYVGGMNSDYERELGFQAHGEAAVVKWNIGQMESDSNKASFHTTAFLPLSSYKILRSLTLYSGKPVVLVREEVENIEGFDRPFQWVQHITFGDPFIGFRKTFVDAPVCRIAFSMNEDDPQNSNTVHWPVAKITGGDSINEGVFNMDKGEGIYQAWLMDPARKNTWFTLYNSDSNVLIGYVFQKEWNPWIGDWRENGSKKHTPWNGEAVAWGLLVGTSPFTPGVRKSIEEGPIFDTPTYRWIGAKQKIEQSYLVFITAIENGYKGVANLRLEEGAIILEEKETGKEIMIPNGFTFVE
jgi:hypothetical protein